MYMGFKRKQIYVDPDCGLKTRTPDEAKDKLRVVVEATRIVREELLSNGHSDRRSPSSMHSGS